MTTTDLAPIVKERTVALDPAAAFDLFTAQIAAWWPVATHSVHGATSTVRFGPGVAEDVVEVTPAGDEVVWGTVLAWDPPRRFVMTWHPGQTAAEATEVEVTFDRVDDPAGEDATLVRLVHRGWEQMPDAAARHASYVGGWDEVLARYA